MADKMDGVKLTSEEKQAAHDVNLVEAMLEDGQTTVMTPAESWEVGAQVFAVVDGENVPLPIGEYALQDGSLIVVENEGVIARYDAASAEEEAPAEAEAAPKVEQEAEAKPKSVIERNEREMKFSESDEFKTLVERVEKLETELASAKSENDKILNMSTEAISKLTDKVTELSAPAEPIKKSPEGNGNNLPTEKVNLSAMTTDQRIKYFNNKLNTFN